MKTRELGKLLGCMGMSDLYGAGDEAEVEFATSGIYFMAHAGKRPSLDQFIASASASFFDHRLNPRS